MKKLLLSVAFVCVASISTNAQTTISQTGGVVPTNSTVACAVGAAPNFTGISETSYFRAYTMTASTKIVSVKVGVGAVTGNFPITVKLHKSNGAFPGSYPAGLTQLSTVTATLSASQNLSLVTVNLPIPVAVASGDIIVAEVHNVNTSPASQGNGSLHFMGRVATQTAPGYIVAAGCQFPTPTSFITLNPDAKIVIDLVEDATASSEQFFAENFTLYPNPTTDVLNISSKNGLNASEIRITDMTGKVVKVQKDASTVNVSNLASGTYLIDITTKEGKATSKFIKK